MEIAIKGHALRGKEVIQILESLGGKNIEGLKGTCETFYYINNRNEIDDNHKSNFLPDYKLYTLEEFEKEFPFKIEDKVKYISSIGIIKEYCYINNEPAYKVKSTELGIIVTMPVKILKPYKEMERNITLTIDKAKEWYKKGGELKEIALQAFSEKELTRVELPKTWEEFCTNYPMKNGECYINSCCDVAMTSECVEGRDIEMDRNVCPSQKSAEAHLAMIQLEQLRNCWWGDWKPIWGISQKWCIRLFNGIPSVGITTNISKFLTFPTKEMAEEFLKCFKDLIEKAGDLI